MPTDLTKTSKGALVRKVEAMSRGKDRQRAAALRAGETVQDVVGTGIAGATAAGLGYAAGRYRNKDGSPMSLGPVPLEIAAATAATIGAVVTGNRAFSYAAAGAIGAYAYKQGEAFGAKQLAKAGRRGVSGVGEDFGLDDDEEALIWGDDDDDDEGDFDD